MRNHKYNTLCKLGNKGGKNSIIYKTPQTTYYEKLNIDDFIGVFYYTHVYIDDYYLEGNVNSIPGLSSLIYRFAGANLRYVIYTVTTAKQFSIRMNGANTYVIIIKEPDYI